MTYSDAMLLHIQPNSIVFSCLDKHESEQSCQVDIAITKIAEKYFVNDIPTEYEVEYAINYIEDELMKNKHLANKSSTLVCHDALINQLLSHDEKKQAYSRHAVESLFTRYAAQSMGRSPVHDNISINRLNYAALLIVREIMHHYNFAAIVVA